MSGDGCCGVCEANAWGPGLCTECCGVGYPDQYAPLCCYYPPSSWGIWLSIFKLMAIFIAVVLSVIYFGFRLMGWWIEGGGSNVKKVDGDRDKVKRT